MAYDRQHIGRWIRCFPTKALDARAQIGLFIEYMDIPNVKQLKVAREVIQEGKSFMESALGAGYSKRVATRGAKSLMRHSKGWNLAFIRAAQEVELDGQMLKKLIVYRLVSDVTRGKDSGVTRQAELIGRLKEVDAFVRNTDVQIGVFASLADDTKVAASVETLSADLP